LVDFYAKFHSPSGSELLDTAVNLPPNTAVVRRRWYFAKYYRNNCVVLGAFAKLRNATFNFVMSVHPSVLVEQLGSHLADIYEIWCFIIFWKNCRENSIFINIWQEYRL